MFFIGLAIGIFIGWNWQQPQIARELQERIARVFRNLVEKIG